MHIKYKISLGVAVLSLLSLYFFFEPVQGSFFPECPFHTLTGLHCPGCGSQRATYDILHANFLSALSHNALMMASIVFGGGLLLYSKQQFLNIIYHPKTPWVVLGVVIAFWILRNIPFYPFSLLAP